MRHRRPFPMRTVGVAMLLAVTAFGCGDESGSSTRPFPSSSIPECLESGEPPEGSIICGGANQREPESVELPTASDQPPSTLQFRVVRGEASQCASRESNPVAAEAVALADPAGLCLDLAPAGLEIDDVHSVKATRYGEDLVVTLQLRNEDVAALNRFAGPNLGKRAATVVFGQIQSVVTIQAPEYGSALSISGIAIEVAARIKAVLT